MGAPPAGGNAVPPPTIDVLAVSQFLAHQMVDDRVAPHLEPDEDPDANPSEGNRDGAGGRDHPPATP
eukprot:424870-Prorocentrum_minimum.AAC.1